MGGDRSRYHDGGQGDRRWFDGAVLACEDAAFGMTAGTHGSTYGGNPLGCAVGNKVLDWSVMRHFWTRSQKKPPILTGLEDLVAAIPFVRAWQRIDDGTGMRRAQHGCCECWV